MKRPSELIHAFIEALNLGDDQALEALCTSRGWSARGNSIGRFVRQAKRQALRLVPLAELVEDDRRAAVCGLVSEQHTGRGHGKLWFTATKQAEWRLEGYTKSDRTAALFASGVLPAIFDPTELPQSDRAAAWAAQVLKNAEAGDLEGPIVREGFERLAHDTEGTLDVVGSHQIAAIGRHIAGIGRRHGPDDVRQTTWFALQDSPDGSMRLIGHRGGRGAALMLTEPTE
mgnify:CR=1 FL=1